MRIFRVGKILRRLNQMIDEAQNGEFEESAYDETNLSKIESKWKHYLAASKMSMVNIKAERENMKGIVSDISHQTRTPLANIKLYTELLEEIEEEEEKLALIQRIKGQSEKLEFLIGALVKMSRLESGVIEIKGVLQPVKQLLHIVMEEIIPKAEKKKITVSMEGNLDYVIFFDLKWTAEALYNIMDNAVKYSPEKSTIRIFVRAYEIYSCISIEDEGIGILEEEKTEIFQRFYRSPRVQQEEGIGIGLYLSREILKRQKGYIKVKGRKAGGTIFEVFLPNDRQKKNEN